MSGNTFPYAPNLVPVFNPATSLLANSPAIPRETLLAWLLAAQTAYIEFQMGGKVVKASYAQGDGTKTVEYSATNIAQLMGLIQLLQSQLGIVRRARKAIGFVYR